MGLRYLTSEHVRACDRLLQRSALDPPSGSGGDGRGETRLLRPLQPSASSRDPQNPWVCTRATCPVLAVDVLSAFPGLPQHPFLHST